MAEKKKTSQSKLKYMVLAVIIAITAWTVVTYTTNPDMTRKITGVKIELQGEEVLRERGLVLLGEEDLPKMTVVVRGKRSDIMSVMDDMKVILDLSSIEKAGDYRVEGIVKFTNARVTAESILSNGVDVTIDKFETRDFPITIFQDGNVEGKLVRSTSVAEKVTLSGALKELDQVQGVYATVHLKDITKEGEIAVNIGLIPKDGVEEEELTTVVSHSKTIQVKNEFFIPVEAIVEPQEDNVPEYDLDTTNSIINPPTVTVGVKEDTGETVTVKAVINKYIAQETDAYIKADESIYVPEGSLKVRMTPIWFPSFH